METKQVTETMMAPYRAALGLPAPHFVDSLDEQFQQLEKSFSQALKIYQKRKGQFPPRIIILKWPKTISQYSEHPVDSGFEEELFRIQRIPGDVSEYCSPPDTALSHQLLQAVKTAAESAQNSSLDQKHKDSLSKATTAVWGPYPDHLQASIPLNAGHEELKQESNTVMDQHLLISLSFPLPTLLLRD